MAKFLGVNTKVGGREFEIPPMPYTYVKQFSCDGTFARVDQFLAGSPDSVDAAGFAAIEDVAVAAIRRNYPEFDRAQLMALLDEELEPGKALGRIIAAMKTATFKPKEDREGER